MAEILLDPTGAKEVVQQQWDSAADGWNDNAPLIRAWLRPATDAMLAMAGIRSGDRVLDVAAGAGDQTIDIARRVGPEGSVLATDLSPGILAHAARNAKAHGFGNVETREADTEALGLDPGSFDAAVCRLGLMFLPDPARGVAEIARALKPGAAFAAIVFAGPEGNPCMRILMATALRHAGLPPRDPFAAGGLMSLGREGHLDALFLGAGLGDVATVRISAPMRLPNAAAHVAFARRSAGPIRGALAALDAAAQAAAWADIEAQLEVFQGPDGWVGPNELLLTVGRR